MSGTTLLLSVPLGLCLLWATGGAQMPRDALERGAVSLNDMFREVEELMEDTQHILEEAVDQINTESAKLSSDLLLGYNNGTKEIVQKGKGVARVLDRTDKETYNKTGETHLPHIRTEMSGPWNSVAHECMVDEDCGDLRYCLYEIESSKCLPCIPTDMVGSQSVLILFS